MDQKSSNQRLGKIEMYFDLFDTQDLNERAIVKCARRVKLFTVRGIHLHS